MRLLLPVFFLTVFLVFSSCQAYEPAEEAFYLTASSATVSPESGQGSASQKITDLWLYVNNQFQGCYSLGHMMPIVSKGKPVRIQVFAGIKNNGISATRIFWPFYQSLILDTAVENGKKFSRSFAFKYTASTKMGWQENFEQTGRTIVKSSSSERDYSVISGAEAFEGKSLSIGLENAASRVMVESGELLELPKGTSNVYLELDYKCTGAFDLGLITDDGSRKHVYRFNTQPEWNKIYLQLAEKINLSPSSDKHKIYFEMLKEDNPDARFYLDNIKVVHF